MSLLLSRIDEACLFVDTANDLSSLKNIKDGQCVNVSGRLTVNDGAGFSVRYSASDTSAVDGGFVFDGLNGDNSIATLLGVTTLSGSGVGRFSLIDKSQAHSKQFGCAADGVTNDRNRLQACFNVISSKTIIDNGNHLVDLAGGELLLANNNARISGNGTIVLADSSVSDAIAITAENVIWNGPGMTGSGDFYSVIPPAENVRYALIRVDGNNCKVLSGTFRDPWMCGIRGNTCRNLYIGPITFIGGPTAQILTYYQAIRFFTCTDFTVDGAQIQTSAGGGKPEEGVQTSGGFNGLVKNINVDGSWDHGIYFIGTDNTSIVNNYTVTDASGIVCSPPEFRINSNTSTNIHGNKCYVSTTPVGAIGMYLRDMHNASITNNFVSGFNRSYQLAPVQYSNTANRLTNITFNGNEAKNWTQYGLIMGAVGSAIEEINITIDNYVSEPGTVLTGAGEGSHINSVTGAGIVNNIKITNSTFIGGRYTIYANVVNDIFMSNNTITGCSISALDISNSSNIFLSNEKYIDAGITSINLTNCSEFHMSDCYSDNPGGITDNVVDGQNTLISSRFIDNTIRNVNQTAFIRCQFAGNTNYFDGNRTGSDGLSGIVTLTNSNVTTILNDNINGASGYTSRISISPLNQSAATLMSGNNNPYVGEGDYVIGTSFRIRSQGAAVGDEIFLYQINQ